MTSSEKGRRGERAAESYLLSRGCTLLERNYRNRRGEIDLVVQENGTVVFIEVKHWTTYSEEDIGLAVDGRKKSRILQAAKSFLSEHPEYEEAKLRFDLIFVPGNGKDLLHLKDVIREES